jgi:hypothetical protein
MSNPQDYFKQDEIDTATEIDKDGRTNHKIGVSIEGSLNSAIKVDHRYIQPDTFIDNIKK